MPQRFGCQLGSVTILVSFHPKKWKESFDASSHLHLVRLLCDFRASRAHSKFHEAPNHQPRQPRHWLAEAKGYSQMFASDIFHCILTSNENHSQNIENIIFNIAKEDVSRSPPSTAPITGAESDVGTGDWRRRRGWETPHWRLSLQRQGAWPSVEG